MEQERGQEEQNLNGKAEPSRAGIFVYPEQNEEGLAVAYELVGGFDMLAAPSILELASRAARQRLGLPV